MSECASHWDEKDELKWVRARAQRRMMIDHPSLPPFLSLSLFLGLEFDFSFRRLKECIPYTTSFLHFFLFFVYSFPFSYSVSLLLKSRHQFSDCVRDPILFVSDPGDFPDARIRSRLKGVIRRGRVVGGPSRPRANYFSSLGFSMLHSEWHGFLDETRAINTFRARFFFDFFFDRANFVRWLNRRPTFTPALLEFESPPLRLAIALSNKVFLQNEIAYKLLLPSPSPKFKSRARDIIKRVLFGTWLRSQILINCTFNNESRVRIIIDIGDSRGALVKARAAINRTARLRLFRVNRLLGETLLNEPARH